MKKGVAKGREARPRGRANLDVMAPALLGLVRDPTPAPITDAVLARRIDLVIGIADSANWHRSSSFLRHFYAIPAPSSCLSAIWTLPSVGILFHGYAHLEF